MEVNFFVVVDFHVMLLSLMSLSELRFVFIHLTNHIPKTLLFREKSVLGYIVCECPLSLSGNTSCLEITNSCVA